MTLDLQELLNASREEENTRHFPKAKQNCIKWGSSTDQVAELVTEPCSVVIDEQIEIRVLMGVAGSEQEKCIRTERFS